MSVLRLLVASASSGVMVLAAGAAIAQTSTPPPPPATSTPPVSTPPATTPPPAAGTSVGELVVTGSRIRRTNYNTASPVQIITPDENKAEGLLDPAQALQHSALAAGSVQINNQFSGFVTNGGPGADSISLRGLGSQRTLVLLNGRRLNPAGISGTVAAVDLNVIPDAMVDHYEILKDGASSIYGSDAIGGVVNIITKDKYDGLTLESDNEYPQDHGAGGQYELSAVWGHVANNFHITASLQYFREQAIEIGDLPNGECPLEHQAAPTVSGFNYGRSYANGSPYCNFSQVDDVSTAAGIFVFSPSAPASNPYIPFAQLTYPNFPRITNIATDHLESTVDAQSPFQRFGGTVIGGVDLPNNSEFYFEGLLTNRQSSQNAFLPQFFPAQAGDRAIVANSPFDPFNPAFNAQPVLGLPVTVDSQNVWAGHIVAGLKGDFGGFLQDWKWDAYATYGFARATYTTRFQSSTRVHDALDAVIAPAGTPANLERVNPVNGLTYTCAVDIGTPSSGCVPLNFFESTAQLAVDPVLAYIDGSEQGHTNYDQVIVSGSANGPLFSLPAGMVQGVIGAEFRYDQLLDNPGPEAVSHDYFNLSTAGITQGNEDVGEFYVEGEAPLLKGVPLIDLLTLNVSGRFTDYKTAGSGFTYKFGLNWQINSTLRVRGSYGTSFRGPALFENYLAAQTSFTGATDPCANYGIFDAPSSNIFKNCKSEGLPGNFPGFSSTPEVFTEGALHRLKPETSNNLTIGPVWQPTFADLQVSIDYYRIEVKNEIATLGPSNILNLCYTSTLFRSGSPYCTFLSARDADGNIENIDDSYLNIADQIVSGVDMNWTYRRKFDIGQFTWQGEFTYALEDNQQLIQGSSFQNFTGTFGEPHFVGDTNVSWRQGSWTGTYTLEYLGPQNEQPLTGDPTSRYKEYQEQQFYHTLSLVYQGDKFKVTAGVRNILNSYPPEISNNPSTPTVAEFANGFGNLNLEGRTFFLDVRKSF